MTEKTPVTFGDRLRAARLRKGLSQTALAKHAGINGHAAANNWENSYNFPELATAVIVAEVLDVSIDWLVWGDDLANGIGARIRKIPPILRESLIVRIHDEITRAEEAAKQLPAQMLADTVKDTDARLRGWSARNKRAAERARKPAKKTDPGGTQ